MRRPTRIAVTALALALLALGALWGRATAQTGEHAYLPQVGQPPHPSPSPSSLPAIRISNVVCRAPTDNPTFEYIELVNSGASAVSLTGWTITNATRGRTYTFPAYTIPGGPDIYAAVYGGIGTNRTDINEFYWGDVVQTWHIGDLVRVRDSGGHLIASTVAQVGGC